MADFFLGGVLTLKQNFMAFMEGIAMELKADNREQKPKRGPGRPRKNSLSVQPQPSVLTSDVEVHETTSSDEQAAAMQQDENSNRVKEKKGASTSPHSEFIPVLEFEPVLEPEKGSTPLATQEVQEKLVADSELDIVLDSATDSATDSAPNLDSDPVGAMDSLGVFVHEVSVDQNGEFSNESIDKSPEELGMISTALAQKQEVGVSKQPTEIHLIDGEKGGVGKSLFARVLIQFFQDRELPFIPVETDRSNSGIAEFYPAKCKYAAFVEDEDQLDKADDVYNFALLKTVIVDLPAQAYRPVSTWIKKNSMFELARFDSVSFYKWFVCDGGYDSLQLLKKTLEEFGDDIHHILVKNLGKCEDWTHLDDEDWKSLLASKNVKVISFPKFYHMERNRIDMKRLSWNDALAETNNLAGFHSISRSRIKSFLREAHAEIASLKLFGGDL
jgi:hypothetical protein